LGEGATPILVNARTPATYALCNINVLAVMLKEPHMNRFRNLSIATVKTEIGVTLLVYRKRIEIWINTPFQRSLSHRPAIEPLSITLPTPPSQIHSILLAMLPSTSSNPPLLLSAPLKVYAFAVLPRYPR
jgi:hypothetical protein